MDSIISSGSVKSKPIKNCKKEKKKNIIYIFLSLIDFAVFRHNVVEFWEIFE
jgi:hypothetical protein